MSFHDGPEPDAAKRHTPVRVTPSAATSDRGDPPSAQALLRLQRLAGNASVSRSIADDEPARSPVLDVVGSGRGKPLDADLRDEMEGRLGHDFGDVRLHTDAQATKSAESVAANAYTVGSDVVMRSDRYDPASSEGKRTLAHELTHVVQQRQGPVAGTPAPGGVSISDPSDQFERSAEHTANAAMTGAAPAAAGAGASGAVAQLEIDDQASTAPVQRATATDEDELQDESTAPVQRATATDEDELQDEAAPAS
jgi:hypothetical protein